MVGTMRKGTAGNPPKERSINVPESQGSVILSFFQVEINSPSGEGAIETLVRAQTSAHNPQLHEIYEKLIQLAGSFNSNPAQQSIEPTKQDVIAKAIEILGSTEGGLSAEEIMRRLNEVKNLLQGIHLPRSERRGLDRALMDIAMHEPNTTREARVLIGDIFEQLAPISHSNGPKRDEQNRIIPITDPNEPLRLPNNQETAVG